MTVAYISLSLTARVNLIRSGKSLSNQDIQNQLDNAKKDYQFGCQFCHLPPATKNHDVVIEEQTCVQRINVSEKQYQEIMCGDNKPSRTICQANNLVVRTKKGWVFQIKKWLAMPEAQRLWLFYKDNALDAGATSHSVHFIN